MVRVVTCLGMSAALAALALPPAHSQNKLMPARIQPKAEVEAAKNDAWKVVVKVDRDPPEYTVNDAVAISVTSAEKGYLYIVNADEHGNIFFLYPNEFQQSLDIEANTPVIIPAPNNPKKFQFRADKAGKEIIKAVVTKDQLTSIDTKDLMSRSVTKTDRTKFVRLVTEALGGDPMKVPDVLPPPPEGKPEVSVQKQKIEIDQPDVYKKKMTKWATGEIVITIADVRQKPEQKQEQKKP